MAGTLNKGEMSVGFTPEGKLRIETGDMGGVSHRAADDFIKLIQQDLGITPETESLKKHHHHSHDHGHTHEGGGHDYHN